MSKCEFELSCHHNDTCGLTGSVAFFASIPGSFVLINGPLWCYFYAMKYIDDENSRAARCISCTGTSPSSLVYGTEKEILRGLSRIQSQGSAERVFLESNCSTGLIGDDVKGIAEEFGGPWPVYTMDSGGLKGSFEKGFARAFLRVVEEMKEESTIPASVNVLGLSEVYLKGREEGNEIRRILKGCGIRVISTPGCESSWHEIMEAPKASFNLVVRDELGLPAAKEMEKRFHIPYASVGLPYGFEGSRKWTEKVISLLSFGKAEPFLDQEKERAEEVLRKGNGLESLWGSLWFDEVLVAAPPSEALGIAEALRSEWIDTARLTVHLLSPADQTCPLADEVRLVTEDDEDIRRDYENWKDGLVLSSSHETTRLERLHKPFVSCHIARPSYDECSFSDLPYCGFRGAALLYEKIWNARLRQIRYGKHIK